MILKETRRKRINTIPRAIFNEPAIVENLKSRKVYAQ